MRTNTVAIAQALAGLEFRPFTRNDFDCWAGAEPDAQIAFTSDSRIRLAIRDSDPAAGEVDHEIAVVADANGIEFSTTDRDGTPVGFRIDFTPVG